MALTLKTRRNRWYKSGTILDTVSGNSGGTWQPVEGLFPLTINVDGSFTATVKLYTSTADAAPTDANANHGVLQTFTSPDTYILQGPVEWVKAEVTGYSGGSITVTGEASEAVS